MSSTCPRNMANFGRLMAGICWRVWGTPANFNGFCVFVTAATSLIRGQPNFARCLASPGLLHYICIFGGSCPMTEFSRCKIHFTSKSCVLVSCQRYCTALQQRRQPNFAAWYKEWNYRTFAEGATYIRHGAHHVWPRPTSSCYIYCVLFLVNKASQIY